MKCSHGLELDNCLECQLQPAGPGDAQDYRRYLEKFSIEGEVQSILNKIGAFDAEGFHGSTDLQNTPKRVAAMWRDLTRAYHPDALEDLKRGFTTFPTEDVGKDMVVIRGTQFSSMCAHHLLPFSGTAHVAYLPYRKMAGLSKFARVIRHFSLKLQTQERLAHEILEFLKTELETENVAVILTDTSHSCMTVRGVLQHMSSTVVSSVSGRFTEPHVKNELFHLLK